MANEGASALTENPCLTLFEVASIQSYVFGSNRLRENLGASYLVWSALEERLPADLTAMFGDAAAVSWESQLNAGRQIATNEAIQAEIVFVGGGNAAVLFRSRTKARELVQAWSRRLIDAAPDLRLAVAHVDCPYFDVKATFRQAEKELNRAKWQAPSSSVARGGIAVTQLCPSSGWAAAERWPDPDGGKPEWLSRAALAKRRAADDARRRLLDDFGHDLGADFSFPDRLEHPGQLTALSHAADSLVRESHVAVVHADGNGLGRRRSDLVDRARDADDLVSLLRQFALGIKRASQRALRKMLEPLPEMALRLDQDGRPALTRNGSQCYLPLRPIVFGGDDLTFVAEGRLGLPLAASYLRAFATERVLGQPVSASAGVAIVGTGFPFSRAYQMAEELTRLAKEARRERDQSAESSWLDYQIALSGVTADVVPLREEYYVSADGGKLAWRPWRVHPERDDRYDWRQFVNFVRTFQNPERWPRSRAKELVRTLELGRKETRQLLARFKDRQVALPGVAGLGQEVCDDGWSGGQTPYFDSLEALDFYLEVRP